jgi:RNA-directed DNA polymerase
MWMAKEHPAIVFERYADDIVVHCRTEDEARFILRKIVERLKACKLEVHPEKTKIVYCKDSNRPGGHTNKTFDFLGFTFKPRGAKSREGKIFTSFSPGISGKAAKSIRKEMRRWRIHRKSDKSLEDLSWIVQPKLRGWINYYGKFYKSALIPVFKCLNRRLVRWAQRKYKRLRSQRRATHWLRRIARKEPVLFAHWLLMIVP